MKLTAPQKNVLETQLYFKDTSIQNIGGYILFNSVIDYSSLDKAVNKLIQNADSLRLKIIKDGTNSEQDIQEYKYEKLYDAGTIKDVDLQTQKWMQEPFNIYNKLYDFKFFKCNDKYGLLVKLHHLVSDAWSIALVVSKIIE